MPFFATTIFLDANHGVVAIESAGRRGGRHHRRGVSVGGDCRRQGMASFGADRLARGNRRGAAQGNQRGPRAGRVAREEEEGEGRGKKRMRKPDQTAVLRCIGRLGRDRPNYWAGAPAPSSRRPTANTSYLFGRFKKQHNASLLTTASAA